MDKIIINREEQFRMMDGSQSYLKKTHRILLGKLLERERKIVEEYLAQVMTNNYMFQHNIAKTDIPSKLKSFSEEESTVGLFAAGIFNNN